MTTIIPNAIRVPANLTCHGCGKFAPDEVPDGAVMMGYDQRTDKYLPLGWYSDERGVLCPACAETVPAI